MRGKKPNRSTNYQHNKKAMKANEKIFYVGIVFLLWCHSYINNYFFLSELFGSNAIDTTTITFSNKIHSPDGQELNFLDGLFIFYFFFLNRLN